MMMNKITESALRFVREGILILLIIFGYQFLLALLVRLLTGFNGEFTNEPLH